MLARPLFRLHSLPIELPTEFLLIKMQVAIINPAFSFFARKVGEENEISPSPLPLPRTIYTTLRWSPCFPNVNNDIFQRFSRRIVLFQNIVLLPFFFLQAIHLLKNSGNLCVYLEIRNSAVIYYNFWI